MTGYYFEAGEEEGIPYYQRQDGEFLIWRAATDTEWFISTEIGGGPSGDFTGKDLTITGIYDPLGAYEGEATVTECVW